MSTVVSIFVALALVLQIIAVAVWCLCWRKINMQVWTAVFSGFVIMFLHRVCEALDLSVGFSIATAIGIALVALIATLSVYRYVRHDEALRKALKLSGYTNDCVAEKLAVHLGDLRDEIRWYEDQAKANGLPRYPK